ncbi:MAG: hypothetical protein LIP23_02990 [Planctomycetes bacterium]|nr:hypothetical protein [Planctomycetota bacterium]
MPFRSAHEVSGKLVRLAEDSDRSLRQLDLSEMQAESRLIGSDIFTRLDPAGAPKAYRSAGAASVAGVNNALKKWKRKLVLK